MSEGRQIVRVVPELCHSCADKYIAGATVGPPSLCEKRAPTPIGFQAYKIVPFGQLVFVERDMFRGLGSQNFIVD